MPRSVFDKPPDKLRVLLAGYLAAQNMGMDELGAVMGCSRQRASRKVNSPGTLTVDELRTIQRGLHIPADEIRAAIKF